MTEASSSKSAEARDEFRPEEPRPGPPPSSAFDLFMDGQSSTEEFLDGLERERHQRRLRSPADGLVDYTACMLLTADLMGSWNQVPVVEARSCVESSTRRGSDQGAMAEMRAERARLGARRGPAEREMTARASATRGVLLRLKASVSSACPRLVARRQTPRLHGLVCRVEKSIEDLKVRWTRQLWVTIEEFNTPETEALKGVSPRYQLELGRQYV